MNDQELSALDATAQAELVRRKELTPRELVESALRRTTALNPKLNAVVLSMEAAALEAADGPLPDGPFRGVPFLVKDLLAACAGVRTTSGSRFTKDFVAPHDSELVTRYRRAGLVIIGKTNTPEFGLLPTTESELLGAAHNPWNLGRSTGGSSGGAAAAVAAGLVPFAHANDGGGSIRIPASCCGLFGLKPTRGRNPLGPDIGDIMHGLVVEHAVTRSVRDSAALLDATEGMDVGAPYAAPPKQRPFLDEVRTPPGRLRLAFTTQPLAGTKVHPDCVAATLDTAKLLEDLGHEVVEGTLDYSGHELMTQAFVAQWAGGVVFTIDAMAFLGGRTPKSDDFEPFTWALYELGRSQPVSMYLLGHAALQRAARVLSRKFVDVDLWLTPTLAEPPPPLGSFASSTADALKLLMRCAEYSPFTALFNVTGQPAMSVPLHWNADGLPIGSHFVARFGDEPTLFRLAAQLEQARPWAKRRPVIS